jgi:hypothetical protein
MMGKISEHRGYERPGIAAVAILSIDGQDWTDAFARVEVLPSDVAVAATTWNRNASPNHLFTYMNNISLNRTSG